MMIATRIVKGIAIETYSLSWKSFPKPKVGSSEPGEFFAIEKVSDFPTSITISFCIITFTM